MLVRVPRSIFTWLAMTACLWAAPAAAQTPAGCNISSYTYNETFTTMIDPNFSSPSYALHPGSVTLGAKGGGFGTASVAENFSYTSSGTRRLGAMVTGDFNGDGTEDIIAINATPNCEVDFISNNAGTIASGTAVATCGNRVGATLAAGDVDNDGRLDFVMASVVDLTSGLLSSAVLYHNTGTSAGKPTFTQVDFTSAIASDNPTWHAAGSNIALADYNGDGHKDLFILSSNGNNSEVLFYPSTTLASFFTAPGTVLLSNAGLATPMAKTGVPAPVGYACMTSTPSIGVSAGGSVLAVADYNMDGLLDIITGSVSENQMQEYFQNPDRSFSEQPEILLTAGGPLLGQARDIDLDGTPDLVFFRSGNACGGTPGEGWVLYNNGTGNLNLSATRLPFGHSISFGGVMNYDNSVNKTPDMLAGRHNATGSYSVYSNSASNSVYCLQGTTTSKNVATLNPNTYLIVSVTVQAYSASIPSGTNMVFQMSNDGGVDWETFSAAELAGTEHPFSHYGADLRWRVQMTGNYATLTGPTLIYAPGSSTTPTLSALKFTYNAVTTLVYSRSTLGSGTFTASGVLKDLLFSADFHYPLYEGELFAYNLGTLNPNTASNSSLSQVNNGAASVLWEAGSILAGQAGSGRTIYLNSPTTVTASDPLSLAVSRVTASDTTLAQVNAQASTLSSRLGVANAASGVPTGTYSFAVSGMGDSINWKLKDPGHSSPIYVGPPNGDPNYLGATYAGFVSAQAARQPMVLMGANDGMLHAFNALTGTEQWGLVPFNLVSKFILQTGYGQNGNVFTYKHQYSLDGVPSVQDIYANGAWRTVAVGGEAQGLGVGSNGYYFGVDVTNPTNPQPLWEFSDILASPEPSCSLTNNCVTTCVPTCTTNTSSCQKEDNEYNSFFSVTAPIGGWISFSDLDDGDCTGTFANPSSVICNLVEWTFQVTTAGYYYPWFAAVGDQPGVTPYQTVSIDSNTVTLTQSVPNGGSLKWYGGLSAYLLPGEHTLDLYNPPSYGEIALNYVYITTTNVAPAASPSNEPSPDTSITVCEQTCLPVCTSMCYSSPSTTAWPQCGNGANLQCCGSVGGDQYCAPAGATCSVPPSVAGQTFSPPAIAQLKTTTGGVWAAFFGSGYNARTTPNVGRNIYAVDAYLGTLLATWNVGDIPQSSTNPSTIDNTIPGGVTPVDVDNDGYVDRVYFGDLEGRLWKINTHNTIAPSGANPNSYPTCVIFDAGDPNQTGQRIWAPISIKPAAEIIQAGTVNVFFGTGGDDRAPDTQLYKFYSIQDADAVGACTATPVQETALSLTQYEWVIGDGYTNTNPPVALIGTHVNDEGAVGDHYWADPTIINNDVVYFTSLPGKIDSVDACTPIGQGQSKVYAYATMPFTDASNIYHPTGTPVLGNNTPYALAYGKVRRAAIQRGSQTSSPLVHGLAVANTAAAGDVFFQSFAGNGSNQGAVIQRLGTPGTAPVKSPLRVIRWREVPM